MCGLSWMAVKRHTRTHAHSHTHGGTAGSDAEAAGAECRAAGTRACSLVSPETSAPSGHREGLSTAAGLSVPSPTTPPPLPHVAGARHPYLHATAPEDVPTHSSCDVTAHDVL